jgi:hypothetical protein
MKGYSRQSLIFARTILRFLRFPRALANDAVATMIEKGANGMPIIRAYKVMEGRFTEIIKIRILFY